MRAVVQRVTKGSVTVDDKCVGKIGRGMVVLLGIGTDDTDDDLNYMVRKITGLRIYDDIQGKMNLSLEDVGGSMLVVSQFTLYGDCRKGKRPGWSDAAQPEKAKVMYEKFLDEVKNLNIPVETGIFKADMAVEIHNDGPVTLLLDSKKMF